MTISRDIRFEDLNLRNAWGFVSTQDPNRGLRFFLPIPNWEESADVHEKIVSIPNKGRRYTFKNYTDKDFLSDPDGKDNQGVKVDGSSAIVFSSLTLEKANQLAVLVRECSNGHTDFNPAVITTILDRAYIDLGLGDRFNKSLTSIDNYFHRYRADRQLGLFLPNKNDHAAIYVAGAGRYLDGPTLEPQEFSNGAFITFPGVPLSELFDHDPQDLKIKSKLIQADVFIHDRDNENGTRLDLSCIPN